MATGGIRTIVLQIISMSSILRFKLSSLSVRLCPLTPLVSAISSSCGHFRGSNKQSAKVSNMMEKMIALDDTAFNISCHRPLFTLPTFLQQVNIILM
jgi:hypothetical protein